MLRISIAVFALLIAMPVAAQDNETVDDLFSVDSSLSSGDLKPTPEMWFYSQLQQQYENPKAAVRRNAERKAAQRQARLAAMKWFGLSNTRPQCTVTPSFADWSPMWQSNNPFFGTRWQATGTPVAPEPSYPNLRRY